MKIYVDHHLGVLIFENIRKLELVVKIEFTDFVNRAQLLEQLNVTSDYLNIRIFGMH